MAQQVRTKGYSLEGGLDLVSNNLTIRPGKALAMENFEPWYNGGYRRIKGNEVFDGRPKPSAAVFYGFDLDTVAALSTGDTLTGDTSGETCVVIGIDGVSIGVTKLSGTLTQGEAFNSGAYTMAATPLVTLSLAPSNALFKVWRLAAEDEYRGDIAVVPGSGEVLGIWRKNANVYAVRDNAGDTAGILHLSSASGWTTTGVTMAHYQFFDAGQAAGPFVEGATVTDTVSGESGTVHRVVLHAGAWDGSAEGYVVITSLTGPMANNSDLQVSAVTVATGVDASAQFAFTKDGEYKFFNHNYYASSTTYRTYGCNGVDPAFEIDENNIVTFILLPNTALGDQPASNTPFLITEHRNYLFIGLPGGIFQHSVLGEPLTFNGFLGAAEFGMGNELTGMDSVAGDRLVVKTDRETRILSGKTVATWDFKLVGEKTGGKLHTSQVIDTAYGFDDLGITNLSRTDAFGDFVGATMSQLINPFLDTRRDNVTTSVVNRKSNQYRLYFDDSTAVVMYLPIGSIHFSQQAKRPLPVAHFSLLRLDKVVKRMYNTEDENGAEVTYFASTDGFVYEDQIGRNFNGEKIASYVRLAFGHMGSPGMRKRFRKMDVEVHATEFMTLNLYTDVDYGILDGVVDSQNLAGSGGFWDISNWDEMVWDAQAVTIASSKIRGVGENIGVLLFSNTAMDDTFAVQSINFFFEPKRLNR